jgi:hypothetical protein
MPRLPIILAIVGLPQIAQAQALHQTVSGSKLEIGLPCAKTISVATDPALSGQVVLDATAAHPEELSQMEFTGGAAAKLQLRGWFTMGAGSLISLHGDCWRPGTAPDFEPTLQVRLTVPPGLPLAIDASGHGEYHVAVGGPLQLASSGSSRLDAADVTALAVEISGSGKAGFARVTGPINVNLSGSGDVAVAVAQVPAVALAMSGSGSFRIQGGHVGKLAVENSGSGHVGVAATVDTASVDGSGSGDVVIARLTGALSQNISGSGGVTVQSR